MYECQYNFVTSELLTELFVGNPGLIVFAENASVDVSTCIEGRFEAKIAKNKSITTITRFGLT